MSKKVMQHRKRLAAVFASISILIMGTASLLQSMSLDYYSVLSTLIKIIPASIVIGTLGWVMGMILDQPKKRRKIGYNSAFVNNIMKNEFNETAAATESGDAPIDLGL